MSNEDGLSSPFDDDVLSSQLVSHRIRQRTTKNAHLSLRDFGEIYFDLGEGENVGGGGHVGEEVGDEGFSSGGGDETHRSDHKVRVGSGGGLGSTLGVGSVVGNLSSLPRGLGGGGDESCGDGGGS